MLQLVEPTPGPVDVESEQQQQESHRSLVSSGHPGPTTTKVNNTMDEGNALPTMDIATNRDAADHTNTKTLSRDPSIDSQTGSNAFTDLSVERNMCNPSEQRVDAQAQRSSTSALPELNGQHHSQIDTSTIQDVKRGASPVVSVPTSVPIPIIGDSHAVSHMPQRQPLPIPTTSNSPIKAMGANTPSHQQQLSYAQEQHGHQFDKPVNHPIQSQQLQQQQPHISAPLHQQQHQQPTQLPQPTTRVIPAPAAPVPTPQPIGLHPIAGAAANDSKFDGILNSPGAGKDEKAKIVEKSPGARYLRFSEKLGFGAYKDVYRAYDTIEGIEVAWNAVNLSNVPKGERQYIVNEVRLLEKLNHANIISFHGSWVNREREQVIFVTEILSSGNLKQFIKKVQIVRWKIAKRWAIQILKGLEYLHSQQPPIIHRDLKCDNIFINGTSGDLRIGDLGLSTVIDNQNKVLSVLGTPEFMAPELYDESYDQKIDIYAFGMCMLEILTKELPYRECSNPAQIYKKVTQGIWPDSLNRLRNDSARDFIEQCLGQSDGNGGYIRPSATELLSHPFLEKNENDDVEIEIGPSTYEKQGYMNDGRSIAKNENLISTENDINTASIQPPQLPIHPDRQSQPVTNSISPTANVNFEILKQKGITYSDEEASRGTGSGTSLSRAGNTDAQKLVSVHPSSHGSPADRPPSQQLESSVPVQQYYSIPTDQGVGVIVTQVGIPSSENSLNGTIADTEQYSHPISDEFDGMPNSETNIKNVKVLMGRGKAMANNDGYQIPPTPVDQALEYPHSVPLQQPQESVYGKDEGVKVYVASTHQQLVEFNNRTDMTKGPNNQQNLVIAALLDEDNGQSLSNDKMKMSFTVNFDVRREHVQFEFDLIEDDPVKVAREMVTELSLPERAILAISETISGLARSARIRQDQHRKAQLLQRQHQQQQAMAQEIQNTGRHDQYPVPRAIVGPDGHHIMALPANFDNGMEQNFNAPAVVYQSYGDAVTPTHFTSIGDMPEPLPQAAAAVVQDHLNDNVPPSTAEAPSSTNSLQETSTMGKTNSGQSLDMHETRSQESLSEGTYPMALSVAAGDDGDDSDDDASSTGDDLSSSTEYIKLRNDYENKLKVAKKVFDKRMENLQRSKEEKEAQHLKNLEKHEKEKIAIEKRVKQATQEQNQRLQKLEQEWGEKVAEAKKSKHKSSQDSSTPLSTASTNANVIENRISQVTIARSSPPAVVSSRLKTNDRKAAPVPVSASNSLPSSATTATSTTTAPEGDGA